MFSSIFGSTPSPQEQAIHQRPPYQQLNTKETKEAYVKAALREQEILNKSQISLLISDVPIQMPDFKETLYIHTLQTQELRNGSENQNPQSKTAILFLHGFGGTCLSLMWTLGSLNGKYQAYAIDLLGMGLSSRPEFNYTSIQDIIDFFAVSIEQWRKVKGINKLILVGHSFGGYMAYGYSRKYQANVEKLFLASPMGGTKRTAEEVEEWAKKRKQESGFFQKQFFSYFEGAWKEKKTLSQFFKSPLIPASLLLGKYIKGRLKVPENISEIWKEYMEALFYLPDSSEKSPFYLLRFPRISAIISIEEMIDEDSATKQNPYSFPIYYIYGETDWMCSDGAKRIVEKQKIKVSYTTLAQASHQMVFDQPKQLADFIAGSIVQSQQNTSSHQFAQ